MILKGADVVLPDRILNRATVVVEGGTIVEVRPSSAGQLAGDVATDLEGHYLLPGFIDVHVHGLEGHDTLDGGDVIPQIARRLPRYGVTAFCPTTIACDPAVLRQMLSGVRHARLVPVAGVARVLPAHLESNFINPAYRGAQPHRCLRLPPAARAMPSDDGEFTGEDILAVIAGAQSDVGIVTVAPELEGGMALTERLVRAGHIVSLGHSAASFDEAMAAVGAGARQATHLFNRMPPMNHRDPGLAAAMLGAEDVAVELICDGYHVHPAMLQVAIAAKGIDRSMAITDATAGAGLPIGTKTRLGGQSITVRPAAAFLDDNTLAGSTLTMDRAFRLLVGPVGLGLVGAAVLCSTTPARELGLSGFGTITAGATADLVVLDGALSVVQTYVAGVPCLPAFAR